MCFLFVLGFVMGESDKKFKLVTPERQGLFNFFQKTTVCISLHQTIYIFLLFLTLNSMSIVTHETYTILQITMENALDVIVLSTNGVQCTVNKFG